MQYMTRAYTLPNSLLDRMEEVPLNRSELLRRAINEASKQPEALAMALQERLVKRQRDRGRTARISVVFPDDTVEQLNGLTEYSQLPTEHVLRLAAEAYLRSLG